MKIPESVWRPILATLVSLVFIIEATSLEASTSSIRGVSAELVNDHPNLRTLGLIDARSLHPRLAGHDYEVFIVFKVRLNETEWVYMADRIRGHDPESFSTFPDSLNDGTFFGGLVDYPERDFGEPIDPESKQAIQEWIKRKYPTFIEGSVRFINFGRGQRFLVNELIPFDKEDSEGQTTRDYFFSTSVMLRPLDNEKVELLHHISGTLATSLEDWFSNFESGLLPISFAYGSHGSNLEGRSVTLDISGQKPEASDLLLQIAKEVDSLRDKLRRERELKGSELYQSLLASYNNGVFSPDFFASNLLTLRLLVERNSGEGQTEVFTPAFTLESGSEGLKPGAVNVSSSELLGEDLSLSMMFERKGTRSVAKLQMAFASGTWFERDVPLFANDGRPLFKSFGANGGSIFTDFYPFELELPTDNLSSF